MIRIHPTADVSPHAILGDGVQVWHQAQIREGAQLGQHCIVGKGAYVDFDVQIGANCKLQNGAFVYHGATLEDGVFIGPGVILTNDLSPRAINPDGSLKGNDDWQVGPIHISYGASLGAGCIVLPGVSVGHFAMIAAGAVVTRNVPAHALALGAPARITARVCACGVRMALGELPVACPACSRPVPAVGGTP